MKAKHYLMIALGVVGLLYVAHIMTQHGGISGFKSGLSVS